MTYVMGLDCSKFEWIELLMTVNGYALRKEPAKGKNYPSGTRDVSTKGTTMAGRLGQCTPVTVGLPAPAFAATLITVEELATRKELTSRKKGTKRQRCGLNVGQ